MSSSPEPLFRFGLIADPQYAAIPPSPAMARYYANSLSKLSQAVDVFNAEDLAFVVTLGDVIDRDYASYDAILPIYRRLRHRTHFLLGNHDFAVAPQHLAEVPARLGLGPTYCDFAEGGFRFILLDGNEVSLFSTPEGHPRHALAGQRLEALAAAGAVNAQIWNGSLGDDQFDWLRATLQCARQAGERVVVMNHYPVYPLDQHNMWDCDRVVALLTSQEHFAAYFCGHNHVGNFGAIDGRYFINIKGMVDTEADNSFAIVDVFPDRLDIRGFGREDSRSLPL